MNKSVNSTWGLLYSVDDYVLRNRTIIDYDKSFTTILKIVGS